MSTRNEFLSALKGSWATETYDMPEMALPQPSADNRVAQFIEMCRFVGGDAIELKAGEDINALIATRYPDAKKIASNLDEVTLAGINPDGIDDPHLLAELDLSVVRGEIGVAENGCVWIPQRVRQKVIYFIPDVLMIVLDKQKIVATMHDAYHHLSRKTDYAFGVFISGPSKTADIEQSLVIGAHGAKEEVVILV